MTATVFSDAVARRYHLDLRRRAGFQEQKTDRVAPQLKQGGLLIQCGLAPIVHSLGPGPTKGPALVS